MEWEVTWQFVNDLTLMEWTLIWPKLKGMEWNLTWQFVNNTNRVEQRLMSNCIQPGNQTQNMSGLTPSNQTHFMSDSTLFCLVNTLFIRQKNTKKSLIRHFLCLIQFLEGLGLVAFQTQTQNRSLLATHFPKSL